MKRLFLSGLMAACVFMSATAVAGSKSIDPNGVSRFFIQYRHAPPQPAYPAPTSTLDPNHLKMLDIGKGPLGTGTPVYSPADIVKLDNESVAHFLATIGFDFSGTNPNVVINGLGQRILYPDATHTAGTQIATWIPFIFGNDDEYYVLYDSAGETGWTVRNVSNIVLFNTSGLITSGTAAGQQYVTGNLISYGWTNHFKGNEKHWYKMSHQRNYYVVGLKPGQQVPNSDYPVPYAEIHSPLQYTQKDVNNPQSGFGSDNLYSDKLNNGLPPPLDRMNTTHHVVTFPEN